MATFDIPLVPAEFELTLREKLRFVYTQMREMQKIVYRNVVDTRIAKEYLDLEDANMVVTGEQKLKEYASQNTMMLMNLSALAKIKTELETELGERDAQLVLDEVDAEYEDR
jgi:hypothetical protein